MNNWKNTRTHTFFQKMPPAASSEWPELITQMEITFPPLKTQDKDCLKNPAKKYVFLLFKGYPWTSSQPNKPWLVGLEWSMDQGFSTHGAKFGPNGIHRGFLLTLTKTNMTSWKIRKMNETMLISYWKLMDFLMCYVSFKGCRYQSLLAKTATSP